MGKYGMEVDNVRSVEVVDANGQILSADEQQHTDLYWALRGGGNFGVASSFEYDAHLVSTVSAGSSPLPSLMHLGCGSSSATSRRTPPTNWY
jgi:hypothetical protein